MNIRLPHRILVIRRDNIGDLVCTTPLFSALRQHFPEAKIDALVNSYNAPVLVGNSDIDQVHVYRKAKHRNVGESRLRIWLETYRLMYRLRKKRFDVIILAAPARQAGALRFARWIGAKQIVAYGEIADGIDAPVPLSLTNNGHEAELVMNLLRPFGIEETPCPLRVFADIKLAELISLPKASQTDTPLIGIHISARKSAQRWSEESFSALARILHAKYGARFLVFWSPGAENHPQHPGDDDKAERLLALCRDLPVIACKTDSLGKLMAGLSKCDRVICSDGGAMHIAAGLGKPTVCFFGNSVAERWHPWGVTHELLQPASRNVGDVSVSDALAAFERLEQRLAEPSQHPVTDRHGIPQRCDDASYERVKC